ncbi:tRNA1(Val) (adenine(37)-N6)-methyltransferase [Parvicella tangerina]|uniref:tRNA1(Val) (Adenine(37)-N6)-methyltransferase n=1 Tax=Parvicella tangerina TaxID=2829795 RepID=A0A916JL26_9FLAO|nr:tRNA1(Val) (adenine(37)-N6)-methyltransferase [Parvicella tangerina]
MIDDSNSAMKVGTDGTMLGCWVNTDGVQSVLDIGCGSGVLTTICAQKNSEALITGIDVEEGAIKDASSNTENLPKSWRDRITITQVKLQDYHPDQQFDLILSNPPFFENSQVSPDDARNFARHTSSLHYRDIIKFAKNYLSESGRLNLVLPYENGKKAQAEGEEMGFFVSRTCVVRPVPQKPPHRLMIEFSNVKTPFKEELLTIETGVQRHDYTTAYKELGKDFYLYF